MSSLDPNRYHDMRGVKNVLELVNLWSNALPGISVEVLNRHLLLTFSNDQLKTVIKVAEIAAVHEYRYLFEVTSSGVPESSRHYDLTIWGVDVKRKGFTIKACAIIEGRGSLHDVHNDVIPQLIWHGMESRPRSRSL